ncbi:DUF397 domain-containing protein [Lentzea alba]|uniref:DUF397 domain-containing protein n=1 Tax=Lentzea alba TaxID=2714351 RepID=UPI0039BEE6EC
MATAHDPLSLTWRKSTYTQANGECVELGGNGVHLLAVRDSKDPIGPALRVGPGALTSFVGAIKRGTYD